MKRIVDLILDAAATMEKYFSDIVQHPLKYGATISYFIICFGASIWLIMFSINFVMTALGL